MSLQEPCGESQPKEPSSEGLFDPETLFEYLQDQVELAYQSERGDDERGRTELNGSFYKREPLPLENEQTVVPPGSTRVVMQPPVSTTAVTSKQEFAEVIAVTLRGKDGHETADAGEVFADQFLVRIFQEGSYGPYQLATKTGVYDTTLPAFNMATGLVPADSLGSSESATEALDDLEILFKPMTRAQQLYGVLSRWKIVATSD